MSVILVDVLKTATIAAITSVENEISNVSDLIIKTDYDAKIKDTEGKSFTTSAYNKFLNNLLDKKIKI